MVNQEKVKQGKKNRNSGRAFELRVRKDLESKGWIVDKWSNNVELPHLREISFDEIKDLTPKQQEKLRNDSQFLHAGHMDVLDEKGQPKQSHHYEELGKIIPAKHKFRGPGIPMAIGTGMPDFICYNIFKDRSECSDNLVISFNAKTQYSESIQIPADASICGVEVKSNGYLTKEEKVKIGWLLENNIFSKILIASKSKIRGEIVYIDFLEKYLNDK